MKRLLLLMMAVLLLSGCAGTSLKFEGKKQSRDAIEETIEDRLEADNPGTDLEVSITDETKKKKKRKK